MLKLLPATAALLILTTTAHAEDTFFRTPSDNIDCLFGQAETGIYLECELREMAGEPIQKRPADCELDWGQRFFLAPDGYTTLACHSDTIQTRDSAVLGYGSTIERGGITCISEKTGLTCRAQNGKGMFLSRKEQRFF
jgi:hypothetical protein